MTPHLRAIEAGARELEVSHDVLKGLLFSMGAESVLLPVEADAAEARRRCDRVATGIESVIERPLDEDEGPRKGQNFYPAVLEELLPELAVAQGYDPQPRRIELPSGAGFPSLEIRRRSGSPRSNRR